MSQSSDDSQFSLDPEILRELEAAEAGLPNALLNDDIVLEPSLLDDDYPLVDQDALYGEPTGVRPAGAPYVEDVESETPMAPAEIPSETTVVETEPPDVLAELIRDRLADDVLPPETAAARSASGFALLESGPFAAVLAALESSTRVGPPLSDPLPAAPDTRDERAEENIPMDPPTPGDGIATDDLAPAVGAAEVSGAVEQPLGFMDEVQAELPARGEVSVTPQELLDVDSDESWFESESPLTQSILDELFAAEAQRRATVAETNPEPLIVSPGDAPSRPLGDAPEGEGWTARLLTQEDLDTMLEQQSVATPNQLGAPVSGTISSPLPPENTIAPLDTAGQGKTLTPADFDVLLDDAGGAATPTVEPEKPSDGPLSQADLDALLAEASGAATEPAKPSDGPLSQADLDALLAEASGAATEPEKTGDTPLSQADLDALLAEATGATTTPPEPEKTGDAPLSQADLDALLAEATGATTTTPEPAKPSDGPLSQADLDALLAEASGAATEPAKPSDGPLSQADLDALLAEATGATTTTPEPEKTDDAPLSQADLDALLAESSGAATEPAKPSDGPLSQADLDALLAEAKGATTTTPEPEKTGDGPLSQADLDALLAEAGGAPSGGPATAGSDTLSQEDLDALLAAAAGAPAPQKVTPAPHPPIRPDDQDDRSVASLTDDDLDGLFDAVDASRMNVAIGQPDDSVLDQSMVDAVLAGSGDEQMLGGEQFDAPVVPGESALGDVSLTRSSIDELMSDLDKTGAGGNALAEEPDEIESGEISQDMIDALIASAQAEAAGRPTPASESEVGSENLAAAATASDPGPDLLSQSDLDKLIEESRRQDKERNQAKQRALQSAIDAAQSAAQGKTAPAPVADDARTRRFRKPGVLWPFIARHYLRLAASLLVGFITAMSTGTLLWSFREVVPRETGDAASVELEVAMARAQDELGRGDFGAAVRELERPVANALPSRLRNDARYLLLEARYRGFRGDFGSGEFDRMVGQIDELVDEAPDHTRAPEALHWKALLFREALPRQSLDIYGNIFERYADGPDMDRMLLEASQLALAQNDPQKTAIFAQDLLRRFPGSAWAGEAKLAIADANAVAGNTSDARAIYVRIAEAEPDSRLGAEAYLRLGKLAYDQGQYDQAIMQLSRRLETTTTTEGNDEVYLLLAQAYRQAGRMNEARDTLTDLLNILEPSAVTPRAYIEYTQVLEALGERDQAVKTAERAALEYPEDPNVLRNHGEFQGLNGNPLAAAVALVAADKAGAGDPGLLLTAARYYRTANMPSEATRTYNQLKALYGGTPASLAGGIEAAELRYEQGHAETALEDLKDLQAATRGTDYYLPTVESMLGIYKDLGLTDHIKAMAGEVIGLSEEPEVLARAAIDLIDAGDLERAQAALDRVDLARLKKDTAFNVLMKEGQALLSVAPQRALEKMEEAYFNYPEARTREADQQLLDTYLATGRAAAARRMVMDLKASTDQRPMDVPYLVDAAVAWGDYLYNKEDHRTAVFAYSIAEEAGMRAGQTIKGFRADPDWARYQRANALYRLADYAGCLALYDQIAASESPWASEAALKANAARIEQRQRGINVAAAQ